MAALCDKVELFIDGELSPEEAQAFRDHLPSAARARNGSPSCSCSIVWAGGTSRSSRGESPCERCRPQRPGPSAPTPLAHGRTGSSRRAPGSRPRPADPPFSRASRPGLARAGLEPSWQGAHDTPPERASRGPVPPRGRAADGWRVLFGALAAGGGGATRGAEGLPCSGRRVPGVEPAGAGAGCTRAAGRKLPDVQSDRAAILLSQRKYVDALHVLDPLLTAHPEHRQARWNRALTLEGLGLSLLAARDFQELARQNEEGWAQDARGRAEKLPLDSRERKARWQAVDRRGRDAGLDGGLAGERTRAPFPPPPPVLLRCGADPDLSGRGAGTASVGQDARRGSWG